MLELTVLPTSIQLIEELEECDAFIIGEEKFSLRLPMYFTHEELLKVIPIIKNKGQKVYIAVNKIIHEYELSLFQDYLLTLSKLEVDGIIFGDVSILQMAKNLNLTNKLIYNPETYITNYESVAFFARLGIKRVSIAKEITLEDILEISSKKLIEVDVLGHGPLNMFHSMRDLVTNYFKFLKHDNPTEHKDEQLYLIEELRDEKYPILEDQNGTHVFSSHDLCTIEYLDQFIKGHLTSIRIDGLFKTDKELKSIVKVYRKAINDYKENIDLYIINKENYVQELKAIPNIRPFDEGFLFKKTVYKGGEHERNIKNN